MTAATFSTSIEAQQAAALLEGYQFEMGSHDARQWVSLWLESYRPIWIRDAVVEALYQGRYKSISVRQILELWTRRGQPIRHVTHEFEAAVCREFGETRIAPSQLPPVQLPQNGSRGGPTNGKVSTSGYTYTPSASHSSITKASPANSGPTAAVSFDLSATPPGMAKMAVLAASETAASTATEPSADSRLADSRLEGNSTADLKHSELSEAGQFSGNPPLASNEPYRRVSRFTAQSPAETEAVLRGRQPRNGVLYSSARAIQPFKPALPFSAKTLRLARQKALV